MGTIGVRFTGVLATVIATWLTARLLVRTGGRRAPWGATAAAVTLGSNLIEGRVTFACGIARGLAALRAITRIGAPRRIWAGVLSFLAGAASPVAALLLAVADQGSDDGRRDPDLDNEDDRHNDKTDSDRAQSVIRREECVSRLVLFLVSTGSHWL